MLVTWHFRWCTFLYNSYHEHGSKLFDEETDTEVKEKGKSKQPVRVSLPPRDPPPTSLYPLTSSPIASSHPHMSPLPGHCVSFVGPSICITSWSPAYQCFKRKVEYPGISTPSSSFSAHCSFHDILLLCLLLLFFSFLCEMPPAFTRHMPNLAYAQESSQTNIKHQPLILLLSKVPWKQLNNEEKGQVQKSTYVYNKWLRLMI